MREIISIKGKKIEGDSKKILDFEILAEYSPIAIYLLRSDGYFEYVNRMMCVLSGYTKDELLSLNYVELIHPDYRDFMVNQVMKRFAENGALPSYEFKAISKDKRELYLQGFFNVVELDKQKYILGQVLDITDRKIMEKELKRREASYRTILETSNLGYFEVDLAGNFTYVNDTLAKLFGLPKEKLIGMNNREYSTPDQARKVFRVFNKVYREEVPSTFFEWEVRSLTTGEVSYIETSVDLIYNEKGKKVGFRGIVRDITEEKKAKENLAKREAYYKAIFEGAGAAVLVIDEGTIIQEVNNTFEKMTGFAKEEVEGKMSWTEIVSEKDLEMMLRYHKKRRKDPSSVPTQYEFRYMDKMGREKWGIVNVSLLPDNKSIVSLFDITERKTMEERLRFLSFHDPLTELYNRLYFDEELARLHKSRNLPISIIVVDLDGLKFINDNFGHKAGDNYIKDAAKVLKESLRASDVIARIGGDEFAIILTNTSEENVKKVMERIRKKVDEFNKISGKFPISLSMGYAIAQEEPVDMDHLLIEADHAMYEDKKNRKVKRGELCTR